MKLSALTSAMMAACAAAAQPMCPTYVRVIHTLNPGAGTVDPLDIYVNGELAYRNVAFRGVEDYIAIPAGTTEVAARTAGSSAESTVLSLARFNAAPNQAYTVGFTGSVPGPAGQKLSSAAPFVNPDVRTPPNPGRISGLWYRWSETNLAIDFRAVAGAPANDDTIITNTPDLERISTLAPKTVIPYGEIAIDQNPVISFYPVLMGQSGPLRNPQRGNAPVAIHNLRPTAGKFYDIVATGDSLLKAHPNNLDLVYKEVTATIDPVSGCTLIEGAGGVVTMVPEETGFDKEAKDKQQTILGLAAAALAFSIACFLVVLFSSVLKGSGNNGQVELASTKSAAGAKATAV